VPAHASHLDGRLALTGTVLVTGATGGIGQAIARALAARGASLILTGRRADRLDALAQEVGGRALVCDLARREEVDRLAAEAVRAEVDVLVANAALPASGLVTEFSQAEIDRMLDVNLRAPVTLARALMPGMISRRRGHLVFISSLSGKGASPASAVYSATKFGLRGFALGIREDLRPHGVGASVVLPGFIHAAGMFAETDVVLPRGVGTRSPEDVAAGVIRAIEQNRAEVDVAPLAMRLGASVASVAPALSASLSRRMGSAKVAAEMAEAQRDKR
jgi:short-subunit dehydrogenase